MDRPPPWKISRASEWEITCSPNLRPIASFQETITGRNVCLKLSGHAAYRVGPIAAVSSSVSFSNGTRSPGRCKSFESSAEPHYFRGDPNLQRSKLPIRALFGNPCLNARLPKFRSHLDRKRVAVVVRAIDQRCRTRKRSQQKWSQFSRRPLRRQAPGRLSTSFILALMHFPIRAERARQLTDLLAIREQSDFRDCCPSRAPAP